MRTLLLVAFVFVCNAVGGQCLQFPPLISCTDLSNGDQTGPKNDTLDWQTAHFGIVAKDINGNWHPPTSSWIAFVPSVTPSCFTIHVSVDIFLAGDFVEFFIRVEEIDTANGAILDSSQGASFITNVDTSLTFSFGTFLPKGDAMRFAIRAFPFMDTTTPAQYGVDSISAQIGQCGMVGVSPAIQPNTPATYYDLLGRPALPQRGILIRQQDNVRQVIYRD